MECGNVDLNSTFHLVNIVGWVIHLLSMLLKIVTSIKGRESFPQLQRKLKGDRPERVKMEWIQHICLFAVVPILLLAHFSLKKPALIS